MLFELNILECTRILVRIASAEVYHSKDRRCFV